MGLQVTRVPELESHASLSTSGRVLSLDPQAFETVPIAPPHEPLAYLLFGLDENEIPPRIDIRFPRSSHLPIGTPIVFDVFLSKEAPRGHALPDGYTVNRYRLDTHGFKPGVPQDALEVECSLTVVETFTFKNGPKSIFILPPQATRCVGSSNTFYPSSFCEFAHLELLGREDRSPGLPSGPTSFIVYSVIPRQDVNRERALSCIGSADINRPTTASVQFVAVNTISRSLRYIDRVFCDQTGRIVTRDQRHRTARSTRCVPRVGSYHFTYTVSDYIYP